MKRPAPFAASSGRVTSLRMSASTLATLEGPPQLLLSAAVKSALTRAFGAEVGSEAEALVFAAKPEFGDYQSNAAMPLAKRLKQKPQEVAQSIVAALGESADCAALIDLSSVTVSGPGFINLRLSPGVLQAKLAGMHQDGSGRLGISREPRSSRQKVVVDFSSPNIAKEMHVGHLRSTIIGDCLSKLLAFLGHDVSRLNHVGDWGTQFGMLITYLDEETSRGRSNISDLVEFYRMAKKQFDEDPVFQERSRARVVQLQGGDPATLAAWQAICEVSRQEFRQIYDMLEVRGLEERGESFYNQFLPGLVAELEAAGHAVVSEGALCLFPPGYSNVDGTPLPLIVRKSDGGFLYATTDLAAVRHRADVMEADRVLYVTDVGQSQHFQMVFDAARAAGLARPSTELRHVPFGLVQGEDGKKFKTRSGETVRLRDLLNEAVQAARAVLRQGGTGSMGGEAAVEAGAPGEAAAVASEVELTEEQEAAARVIGIGAVKYADLSMNRESNYRFSFKKVGASASVTSPLTPSRPLPHTLPLPPYLFRPHQMLALQGNTAPYMLYAFARIQVDPRFHSPTLLPSALSSLSCPPSLLYSPLILSLVLSPHLSLSCPCLGHPPQGRALHRGRGASGSAGRAAGLARRAHAGSAGAHAASALSSRFHTLTPQHHPLS